MTPSHASRVESEIATYADTINIHDLPKIFHYWSGRYLGPDLQAVFGSADLHGIFAAEFRSSMERTGVARVVSVGAGDGTVEAAIARRLIDGGFIDFQIDCLELSPHLIGRGEACVQDQGVSNQVRFVKADLTDWRASRVYGAAFAHHSLHHIVALEHVFDELRGALADGGSFVISDMIGRNGHMRWPETEAMLSRIWANMPDRYRYNHQLKRHETEFANWDCSTEGFEGIRAQDIMAELAKRFHFHKLVVWGGLTDVFVDRCFGHNLDPGNTADCAFIDTLAQLDRALLRAGACTATQVIGVMRKERGDLVSNGFHEGHAALVR